MKIKNYNGTHAEDEYYNTNMQSHTWCTRQNEKVMETTETKTGACCKSSEEGAGR